MEDLLVFPAVFFSAGTLGDFIPTACFVVLGESDPASSDWTTGGCPGKRLLVAGSELPGKLIIGLGCAATIRLFDRVKLCRQEGEAG